MKIISLASGSTGNAYCVCSGEKVLLIDCGICFKTLKERCAAAGIQMSQISAMVITHSHSDHVKGIPVFHKNLPMVPLYTNAMTAEVIAWQYKMREDDFITFENGQDFEEGSFGIRAFSIPHDTPDPVGYIVKAEGVTYFHGTDIGMPLDSIGVQLATADVATLESNHDLVLLHQSARPESLKQRIWGPRGHLSNEQASELVKKFASPKLKKLNLAHLSNECNAPHIANAVMREALEEIGRMDLALDILAPDHVSGAWEG